MSWIKKILRLNPKVIQNNHNTTQSSTIINPPIYPSLDLAFSSAKERISSQIKDIDALDTKANIALGAVTGVISAALIFQPSLFVTHNHSNCTALIPNFIHTLPLLLRKATPLLLLLLTYILTVVLFFFAYRTSGFQQVPNLRTFLQNLHVPEEESKAVMYATMVEVYEFNKKRLNRKAILINAILIMLGVETSLLGLLLLYHLVC